MCFTNVNEAGKRYRYFMYSTNKCTDFNKNITQKKKKKKKKKKKILNVVCIVENRLIITRVYTYIGL